MKRFFKWESKPNGNCPVQSNGWFLNYYFYFRARGEFATIEFYKDKGEFYGDDCVMAFYLKKTKQYEAGWLSKRICKFLIYKGCIMILLKPKSKYIR
jgi:hypothetical protein